jgi:hypothetical protein
MLVTALYLVTTLYAVVGLAATVVADAPAGVTLP